MIVCVCNNISEREIRQAVALGVNTMPALRKDLGVATCCGKCHMCAKHVLKECLASGAASSNSSQPMLFQRNAMAA
jgi:bacterioferritin-associated ferredoxin